MIFLQTIENKNFVVKIAPKGAELYNITSKKDGYEYLWQGDESVWSGRSPLLFPVVGRVHDDELLIKGEMYKTPKHGFARSKNFESVQNAENEVCFFIKSDEETKEVYPYDFEMYITYTLEEDGLLIKYVIKNKTNETMYFSFGAHPGFNCEIGDVLEFEKEENLLKLEMNENAYIFKAEPFLNNEKCIEIKEDTFIKDAIMFEKTKSNKITLKRKNGFDVLVEYNEAPFLGIWAKPGAKYVCIEPWFGINDYEGKKVSIEEKKGIVMLDTEKDFVYSMKIKPVIK